MEEKVKRTIISLESNGFTVFYFESPHEALVAIMEKLSPAQSISRGGSMTVESLGILEEIKKQGLPFRDYLSPEDRRASIHAEYYLTGSNAVTEDGLLVNTDGAGNRIAAMCFGPSQVFIVVGVNKIVKDEAAGLRRIKEIAAPLNAKRLNKQTPCATTGICSDCSSPQRICRKTMVLKRPEPGRVTVFIINQSLGL